MNQFKEEYKYIPERHIALVHSNRILTSSLTRICFLGFFYFFLSHLEKKKTVIACELTQLPVRFKTKECLADRVVR